MNAEARQHLDFVCQAMVDVAKRHVLKGGCDPVVVMLVKKKDGERGLFHVEGAPQILKHTNHLSVLRAIIADLWDDIREENDGEELDAVLMVVESVLVPILPGEPIPKMDKKKFDAAKMLMLLLCTEEGTAAFGYKVYNTTAGPMFMDDEREELDSRFAELSDLYPHKDQK